MKELDIIKERFGITKEEKNISALIENHVLFLTEDDSKQPKDFLKKKPNVLDQKQDMYFLRHKTI